MINEKKSKSNYHFDAFFNPSSIAVIGAREKANSVGSVVFKNLLESGYSGRIYPVNPKHNQIFNRKSYKTVVQIPENIDLAIIVTPAVVVSEVLKQCAEKKIKAAIIISSGFKEIGLEGEKFENEIKDIIKKYPINVIGPNCLGVISPSVNMNATFGNLTARKGNIALISQSGALCAAILDWANTQKIGFSVVVSLGNAVDVGFAEILQYLESDPHTLCILMYIEGVQNPKVFYQNLKNCTQKKPVIIIKGGLFEKSSQILFSHTGALIGRDDVFNAVLKQSGAIRVSTIKDFFNAAEIFSKQIQLKNGFLTIVSNGGGAGIVAADEALRLNVNLHDLHEDLVEKLNNLLPKHWSHGNPIDIIGDASPERFEKTLTILLEDDKSDAILVILVPVTMANPEETAKKIIKMAKSPKTILTCWMGTDQVTEARSLFHQHDIPTFETPEEAVQAYSLLIRQREHKEQVKKSNLFFLENVSVPNTNLQSINVQDSNNIMNTALLKNRTTLNLIESKAILKNFNIPIAESFLAKTVEECKKVSQQLGYPLAMKILSPDITHKQEVGGVQLNITTEASLLEAFNKIIKMAKEKNPNANIEGVTLEKMYKHPNNRELMIGILKDPIFGPVVSFGAGGSIVEIMQDRSIALPPLNMNIIDNLISETKISKMLGIFRGMPGIRLECLKQILLRISDITQALPQIVEMDINPLIANENEVIAVDARIVIEKT